MSRKKETDFIMCKLDKSEVCIGCLDCLEKPKEYKYKKTDVWNIWLDESPVMKRKDGTIRKL